MTRIAVISDIHHGPRVGSKRGDRAMELMEEFRDFVAIAEPDLVLDLGDRISDVDAETDALLMREVAEAFRGLDAPLHHICGNHDRTNLSIEENEELLWQNDTLVHQVIDLGRWQLAIWRADAKVRQNAAGSYFDMAESDLLWLSEMAQSAKKPTLVASHVPISGHSQIGNYYFQNGPQLAHYPRAERARAALEQARQPMVMISGHVHWNTICQINGVWHLTQQSLTESFATKGQPAAAWSMIDLGDIATWTVYGEDPFAAAITPRTTRWAPPRPEF